MGLRERTGSDMSNRRTRQAEIAKRLDAMRGGEPLAPPDKPQSRAPEPAPEPEPSHSTAVPQPEPTAETAPQAPTTTQTAPETVEPPAPAGDKDTGDSSPEGDRDEDGHRQLSAAERESAIRQKIKQRERADAAEARVAELEARLEAQKSTDPRVDALLEKIERLEKARTPEPDDDDGDFLREYREAQGQAQDPESFDPRNSPVYKTLMEDIQQENARRLKDYQEKQQIAQEITAAVAKHSDYQDFITPEFLVQQITANPKLRADEIAELEIARLEAAIERRIDQRRPAPRPLGRGSGPGQSERTEDRGDPRATKIKGSRYQVAARLKQLREGQ